MSTTKEPSGKKKLFKLRIFIENVVAPLERVVEDFPENITKGPQQYMKEGVYEKYKERDEEGFRYFPARRIRKIDIIQLSPDEEKN